MERFKIINAINEFFLLNLIRTTSKNDITFFFYFLQSIDHKREKLAD